ncbi:hypothetical protein SSTU70S_00880 [Stutzerimonas stutzeri]
MSWKVWPRFLPAKEKRAPKALPNGLSIDQQDAIKALVKARVEALPKEKQAKAAVTCWSALKSKFGCSYKKIESDQFAEAVGLVARIELEGEWLPKAKEDEFVLGFYEAQEVCHLVHHAIWCVYRWDSGIAAGASRRSTTPSGSAPSSTSRRRAAPRAGSSA